MAHARARIASGKVNVATACVAFGTFYGVVCGALCGSLAGGAGGVFGAVAGGTLGSLGGGLAGIIGTLTGGPRGWCLAGVVGAVMPMLVLGAAEMAGEEPFFLALLMGGLALLGGSLGYAVGSRPGSVRCSLPGVPQLARLIQEAPPGPLSETPLLYPAEVLPAVAPEGRGDEASPANPAPCAG